MQIQTNRNQRELKTHGDFAFPILVSRESITAYEFGTFSWHWHPEIELTLIEDGEMLYQINGRDLHAVKDQIIFANSNTLHSGHTIENRACHYWSITFDPKLIYGFENSLVQTKYVDLVTSGREFSALYFDGTENWHREIQTDMKNIIKLEQEKPEFYEMETQMSLCRIWLTLLKHREEFVPDDNTLSPKTSARLKAILGYIHENYDKKISLDNIADSVHICKSECCRFFKKHMQESLFDYLLRYRVEQSIPYLRNPEYTVTDAAFLSGFTDAGYYSRVFRKYAGSAPRDFRKVDGG